MLHFLYLQEWNPVKEVLSVLHMLYICIRDIEGIKEEERNSRGGCLMAVSSFIKAHPHFPSDNQTLLSNSVKLIHHSLQKNLFSLSRVEENGFDPKEKESIFPPLHLQLCFCSFGKAMLLLNKASNIKRKCFVSHLKPIKCLQFFSVLTEGCTLSISMKNTERTFARAAALTCLYI